ncbi:hypothetical protein BpHYR1_049055 [Brachionus plicatilis]|uniref:Uncharacterized protein n=1 Tax=Brachionus plicatilis TaxID=10195 RepID=A0A3M7SE09_BRAPC|nr:hypothetical protein BpHYR1_049055 [Brachionus plicatilis]
MNKKNVNNRVSIFFPIKFNVVSILIVRLRHYLNKSIFRKKIFFAEYLKAEGPQFNLKNNLRKKWINKAIFLLGSLEKYLLKFVLNIKIDFFNDANF